MSIRCIALVAGAFLGSIAAGEENRLAEFETRLFETDPAKLRAFFRDATNSEYRDIPITERLPLALRYAKTIQPHPEPTDEASRTRDFSTAEHLFLEKIVKEAGKNAKPLKAELLRLARDPENRRYCRIQEIKMLGLLLREDSDFHKQLIAWLDDPTMDVALVSARLLSELKSPTAEMLAAIEARIAREKHHAQLLTFGAAIEAVLNPVNPKDAPEIVSRSQGHRLVRIVAAMEALREELDDLDGNRRQLGIDRLYRAYLDVIERHPDQRVRSLAMNHMKALPSTSAADVAGRVLDLLPQNLGVHLPWLLDKIRPFPEGYTGRIIAMVGSEEMSWHGDNDRALIDILALSGPRAAAVLPKILANFETLETQFVPQIETYKADGRLAHTSFGYTDLLNSLTEAMIAIGPGDTQVREVFLERLSIDQPFGKALADYARANAGHGHILPRLLLSAELLSWPNLESRTEELFAHAEPLLDQPEPFFFDAGCKLITGVAVQLDEEQVASVLPRLINRLNREPKTTDAPFWEHVPPIATLKALKAFGTQAEPAIAAVERFSQQKVPRSTLANYRWVAFLELAKEVERAIRR